MTAKIIERIGNHGPHRILALDGGGVRGIISIAFLEEIEATLASRAVELGKVKQASDFRLSQYFDLIGGTSAGSILAVLLALGWRVADIREKFEAWAPGIFRRPWYKLPLFSPKFNARTLQNFIVDVLGDMELGSDKFQTVVAVIAKRLDTGSSWVLTNSPFSKYWDENADTGTIGNKAYKLVDVIRASTAAPYYFAPRKIQISANQAGLFADGGVSPHNTPALQLLMLAGMRGYKFGWDLGADKLLIVSVGTGLCRFRITKTLLNRLVPRLFAVDCLQGLITDGQQLSLKLLQWMSTPRRPWKIDGEVGTLENDELFAAIGVNRPMLSFVRYDIRLERDWLLRELDKVMSDSSLEYHRAFDQPANIPLNYDLAKRAAKIQVTADDFPEIFDT